MKSHRSYSEESGWSYSHMVYVTYVPQRQGSRAVAIVNCCRNYFYYCLVVKNVLPTLQLLADLLLILNFHWTLVKHQWSLSDCPNLSCPFPDQHPDMHIHNPYSRHFTFFLQTRQILWAFMLCLAVPSACLSSFLTLAHSLNSAWISPPRKVLLVWSEAGLRLWSRRVLFEL